MSMNIMRNQSGLGRFVTALALGGAAFGVQAQPSGGKETLSEPLSALKQPQNIESNIFGLIKRDAHFFQHKTIVAALATTQSARKPADTKTVEKSLAELKKEIPAARSYFVSGEATALDRFDRYVEHWLLKQPEKMSKHELADAINRISEESIEIGSQTLVARKAFTLLALGEKDASSDKFAFHLLAQLHQDGSLEAALSLTKIALYATDDKLAMQAAKVVAGSVEEAIKLVTGARNDFSALRDVALQSGHLPLTMAALEEEKSVAGLHATKLPALIDAVQGVRIAFRQREIDTEWSQFDKERREAIDRESRRVKITEDNDALICIDHTAVWGLKGGKREIDQIPVGARITGVKANFENHIYGMQLLYEKGGKSGETPWRGSKKGKHNIHIEFDSDEYIKEFQVKGFPRAVTLIKLITNKRTHIICEDRVVDEGAIRSIYDGKMLRGELELSVMGLPIGIGMVTYADDKIKAFGLVRQWNGDSGISREITKEEVARRIPKIQELK